VVVVVVREVVVVVGPCAAVVVVWLAVVVVVVWPAVGAPPAAAVPVAPGLAGVVGAGFAGTPAGFAGTAFFAGGAGVWAAAVRRPGAGKAMARRVAAVRLSVGRIRRMVMTVLLKLGTDSNGAIERRV
jgi:hypothetical protein